MLRIRPFFKTQGFTIVELLIVIVVIGILAAIVIVAYNGITTRAQNNARVTEMKAWQKLLEVYRAQNGQLPDIADDPLLNPVNERCLGTGFPKDTGGGNIPRCRSYMTTNEAFSDKESDGQVITDALASVGSIPSSPKVAVNGVAGPYVVTGAVSWVITGIFNGDVATDCPAGTTYAWGAGGNDYVACTITIAK